MTHLVIVLLLLASIQDDEESDSEASDYQHVQDDEEPLVEIGLEERYRCHNMHNVLFVSLFCFVLSQS